QDTKSKQEKVEEVLAYIEDRLSELEAEKTELTEYEQLDKQRRALEHALCSRELGQAKESLEGIDQQRDQNTHSLHEHHRRLYELQDIAGALEVDLQTHQAVQAKLQTRVTAKQAEHQKVQVRYQQVEQEIQDYRDKLQMQMAEAQECQARIDDAIRRIAASEAQVAIFTQDSYTLEQSVHGIQHELQTLKNKLEMLALKKQQHKFSNQKERDAHINSEISSLQAAVKGKQTLLQTYRQNLADMQGSKDRYEQAVTRQEQELQSNAAANQRNTASLHTFMNNRNAMQDRRKELWMETEKCQEEKVRLSKELSHSKELLNKTLPFHIVQGLQIIETLISSKNIEGYYGPLIDNIIIKRDIFNTVVDKVAGNQLFHIVVENEEVANICIKHLEDNYNIGRLTFLPLNRLRVSKHDYTAVRSQREVKVLMDVALEYEDFMKQAVELVSQLLAQSFMSNAAFICSARCLEESYWLPICRLPPKRQVRIAWTP
ncbi:hypothetical protein EON64_12425, partial [archaeon]